MVHDQFKAIFHLAAQITETVKGDEGSGQLAAERELLGKALEDVQGIIGVLRPVGHGLAERPARDLQGRA